MPAACAVPHRRPALAGSPARGRQDVARQHQARVPELVAAVSLARCVREGGLEQRWGREGLEQIEVALAGLVEAREQAGHDARLANLLAFGYRVAVSDSLPTRLGQNVRQLREARGLTQEQVARLAKLPRATWSHVESGAGNPTLAVLARWRARSRSRSRS